MAQEAQPTSNQLKLVELVKEYSDDVTRGELQDILEAIKLLKAGSGWGRIEIVYLNSEMNDVDIIIKRKKKKQLNT